MTSQATERASPARRVARNLKGLLLWEHERGSWQYDVMVALILLFVFGMPRHYFNDRPTPPRPEEDPIQVLESAPSGVHVRVSARLLSLFDPDPREAARKLFSARQDHPVEVTRIEPSAAETSEGEVLWYDIWLRAQ